MNTAAGLDHRSANSCCRMRSRHGRQKLTHSVYQSVVLSSRTAGSRRDHVGNRDRPAGFGGRFQTGAVTDYLLRPIGAVESELTDRATAPRQADEGAPPAW